MGIYPAGKIIKASPTISTDAYGAADLVFDKQELKSAVPSRGGVSLIRSVSLYSDVTTDVDYGILFFDNSTGLGANANDALTNISDAEFKASGFIGAVGLNGGNNRIPIGNGSVYTQEGTIDVGLPLLISAANNQTSIWFACVTDGGTPTHAADGLQFTFNIQYLG